MNIMKTSLLSLLVILLFFSCSKEENPTTIAPENIEITGKLFAPNNLDPIVNAKVSALNNDTVAFETKTDPQGNFTLSLPKGLYDVKLAKGLFKTETSVSVETSKSLDTLTLDDLPNIGVITGAFDNIESVLYSIGLVDPQTGLPLFDIIDGLNTGRYVNTITQEKKHIHGQSNVNATRTNTFLEPNVDFSFSDLLSDPTLLASYDILFINCSPHNQNDAYSQNLRDYVSNGGYLYVTDWSSDLLNVVNNNDTEYLSFYTPRKSGQSLSTVATILDTSLNDWLLLNFGISVADTVEIDEFIGGWQVVESFDPATTTSWLNGPVEYRDADNNTIAENKDLAFTFPIGDGGVFYSSFHTENHALDFSTTDRIMEYLVFEMTDTE